MPEAAPKFATNNALGTHPAQLPTSVRVVEVGPRDGLQNERLPIPTSTKLAFIDQLSLSGLRDIEVTSFVRPGAIPQLSDAEEVMGVIEIRPGVRYSALIPNVRGLERWLACVERIPAGSRSVAFFTAASESFNLRNTQATIAESLDRLRDILARLDRETENGRPFVRGYVSTTFRCPFEGWIEPAAVRSVCDGLLDLGVDELSLGDTVGAATPEHVFRLLDEINPAVGTDRIAMHFHDTRGTALANVLAAMTMGITIFDSSAGGLGGCPYAPGATGNLATEDLLYMLAGMNIETRVSLPVVVDASRIIEATLDHPLPSRELRAFVTGGY
ncbi:MAG TPA: hydroxymethylglutaryl-CoA lyase [Chloroflexota bacterium]|jgi:isopropylmalate/homocitrate/citramalate synthase|nr:hydroxymethylglutaryl-CoA lyase [Chloroflexota bacterium]